MMFKLLISLILTLALVCEPVYAQSLAGVLLQQESDSSPSEPLTPGQLESLGDPFFDLVLKEHANVTSLSALEDFIQPDGSKRQTFVVDEKVADPTLGQSRRAVLAYSGRNGVRNLDTNVMLSVSFNSSEFSDQPTFIEAWGWDDQRGRFNYYKLDQKGTDGPSWKFRGSSDNADQLSAAQRRGTCMACHINGAPIMKELLRPWNNWHSEDFPVKYLNQNLENPWPVAANAKIANNRLKVAPILETSLVTAIRRFNTRRIRKSIQLDANGQPVIDQQGRQRVIEGQPLLKQLFTTTEFNIITADRPQSGLHPFPEINTDGPTENIKVPNSFFLNANLISGGTPLSYKGLGIRESQTFDDVAELTPDEYKDLVIQKQVRLGGRQPGDAVFAWLVPEPSHIDNDLADQLIRQGIVTPEFVAAVMAIDLESPILSDKRLKLLDLMPNEFLFKPLNGADPLTTKRHPDELTRQVISELEILSPSNSSPEGEFLEILKSDEPILILEDLVKEYRSRLVTNLDRTNTSVRKAELERLYDLAITRRSSVLRNETLSALNETRNLLLPLPQ